MWLAFMQVNWTMDSIDLATLLCVLSNRLSVHAFPLPSGMSHLHAVPIY